MRSVSQKLLSNECLIHNWKQVILPKGDGIWKRADLKLIYRAAILEEAETRLLEFAGKWSSPVHGSRFTVIKYNSHDLI